MVNDGRTVNRMSVYTYKQKVDPSSLSMRELESLLSPKQKLFCVNYLKYANATEAAKESGYSEKSATQTGRNLLAKNKFISEYVARKQAEMQTSTIADAQEILQYLTDVMRGEVKDQFGIDASLAERTKAAMELARRQIDLPAKLAQDQNNNARVEICITRNQPEAIEADYTEVIDA